MSGKLSILGAGGHGKVIADTAERAGSWSSIDFLDDGYPQITSCAKWDIDGTIEQLFEHTPDPDVSLIVGIGNNQVRSDLQQRLASLGWKIAVVVHPDACISKYTDVGNGTVVMAGVTVNIGSKIGDACILNTNASIDHDCQIANAVHISPGAVLAGTVTIGTQTWIGAGTTVINNCIIGKNTVVGAGSTVVKSLPDDVLAVGTPCQVVKNL